MEQGLNLIEGMAKKTNFAYNSVIDCRWSEWKFHQKRTDGKKEVCVGGEKTLSGESGGSSSSSSAVCMWGRTCSHAADDAFDDVVRDLLVK